MSLREEIGEIYWAIDEGDHRIDEIINKVLDAAVEAINTDFDDEEIAPDANFADGVHMSLEAINKLRD